MSASTTYRPMHVPARWLLAVLVAVLVIIAIELSLASVQRSASQPVRAQSQPMSSHAMMSGDFRWIVAA